MKKVIENIGKKVLDFIYDFENNEYDYEGGCYEPWNGISEKASVYMNIHFDYKGHEVTGSVYVGRDRYVEVLFESDNYENIETAVNEYVKKELNLDDWYSCAMDDMADSSMDEYQRNGFANEADYIRYRYSA